MIIAFMLLVDVVVTGLGALVIAMRLRDGDGQGAIGLGLISLPFLFIAWAIPLAGLVR